MGINPGNPNQARGGNPENPGQFSSDGSRRSETDLSTDLYDSSQWSKACDIEDEDERVVALAKLQGIKMVDSSVDYLGVDGDNVHQYRVTLVNKDFDEFETTIGFGRNDRYPTMEDVMQCSALDYRVMVEISHENYGSYCDEMGIVWDAGEDYDRGTFEWTSEQSPEWKQWDFEREQMEAKVHDMRVDGHDDEDIEEAEDDLENHYDHEPMTVSLKEAAFKESVEQCKAWNDFVDGRAEDYTGSSRN